MSGNYIDKIFSIEVEKIKPNPFQPRREFNEERLRDLADSIKEYGVLQPLVVTRKEIEREDGSLFTEYELIAGERRWRAAQIAGLRQVPAIIRTGEQSDKEKLEMAIIENLQREDLNPVERAQAFFRLANDFNLSHADIGKKVGRSREYVSNTIRILNLPQEILDGLNKGEISEGHTRPLLMLGDRPEEQKTVFTEIKLKSLSVRDTESIARRIAYDKIRRHDNLVDPDILEMEDRLTEKIGNRVKVEKKSVGGQIVIDWLSENELRRILGLMDGGIAGPGQVNPAGQAAIAPIEESAKDEQTDSSGQPAKPPAEDDDLYFIKNFSV